MAKSKDIVKAVVSKDDVFKGGAYSPPGPLAVKPNLKLPPKPSKKK